MWGVSAICVFRMAFRDFTQEFQKLEICNLGPDSLDEDDLGDKKRWEMNKEHGAWVRRVNAGGCRNYLGLFGDSPALRNTPAKPQSLSHRHWCTWGLVSVHHHTVILLAIFSSTLLFFWRGRGEGCCLSCSFKTTLKSQAKVVKTTLKNQAKVV